MTAATSEKLAKALDDLGLSQLAHRARADEFHDYLSPHATPEIYLCHLLLHSAKIEKDPILEKRILNLRQDVMIGEHDASTEESDEWAASPDGIETFRQFFEDKK